MGKNATGVLGLKGKLLFGGVEEEERKKSWMKTEKLPKKCFERKWVKVGF
jgi:hypothetical protein